jgi:hypothetical protein
MQSSFEVEQPNPEVSGRYNRPVPFTGKDEFPKGSAPGSRMRQLQHWTGVNYLRESWAWVRGKRLLFPSVSELGRSLAALEDSSSRKNLPADDPEAPIFLLATGWRTGSTLLQRILVTDQRLLLWGEPFGEMALVSTLAETLSRLSTFPDLKKYCAGETITSSAEISDLMAKSWIATLYTSGEDLRVALRALLSGWLGRPAAERGFSRWGFKEVRLGATEATLLHWLYPNAKFVILSRHPFDCYRSLSDSGWHHIYHRRPDIRVDSAAGFARHWNRVAVSWSELPAGFPFLHIKYEDLVQGKVDFRGLESWLGVEIKEDAALSVAVGHTAVRNRLSWLERLIIVREADEGMQALGYSSRNALKHVGDRG